MMKARQWLTVTRTSFSLLLKSWLQEILNPLASLSLLTSLTFFTCELAKSALRCHQIWTYSRAWLFHLRVRVYFQAWIYSRAWIYSLMNQSNMAFFFLTPKRTYLTSQPWGTKTQQEEKEEKSARTDIDKKRARRSYWRRRRMLGQAQTLSKTQRLDLTLSQMMNLVWILTMNLSWIEFTT